MLHLPIQGLCWYKCPPNSMSVRSVTKENVQKVRSAETLIVASELLSSFRNLLGLLLLDLGPPGLLLSFELQSADMLAGLADTLAGSHEGTISLPLRHLGTHDPLTGSDDAGIHLVGGTVAKGPTEKTTTTAAGTSGATLRRGLVGRVGVPSAGAGSTGRRWGAVATEEAMFLGLLLVDRLRCRLYRLLGGL